MNEGMNEKKVRERIKWGHKTILSIIGKRKMSTRNETQSLKGSCPYKSRYKKWCDCLWRWLKMMRSR